MRTYLTTTCDSPDLIASTWVIDEWLIDEDTPVLSLLITTNIGILKPNIVTSNLETNAAIEAADKYVATTTALKIMDPYKP